MIFLVRAFISQVQYTVNMNIFFGEFYYFLNTESIIYNSSKFNVVMSIDILVLL